MEEPSWLSKTVIRIFIAILMFLFIEEYLHISLPKWLWGIFGFCVGLLE